MLCVANTWFKKRDERKGTCRSGVDNTEIDFVLAEKVKTKF